MFTTDDIAKTTSRFDEVISSKPRPRDPSASPNAYQNLSVVKKITKGKFPIYLTSSKINKQNYAMKIFCHDRKGPQMYYQNEIRFASLKHPNIIDMVYYENEKGIVHKGELKKVSYILTEYAPHGDFFDLVADFRDHFDDKLARTYFRQLIEGMEYLHANDIAHLDLKPENLLLGADFNLKIADFDLSHKDGDAMLLGRGTRNYRAPEFFGQTLQSGRSLADLFAADIYSAGIILFILKSGMYPHSEYHLLEGVSFVDLMYDDNQKFWIKHCEVQERETSFFSAAFKELFNGMVKANPKERLTIKEIKASMWYNGPIYTPSELANKMKSLLYC